MQVKQVSLKLLNGFFNICNKIISFLIKYPLLVSALVVVLAIAIIILLVNNKANVGGILGKVLGLFNKDQIEKANSVIASRKQKIGESDSQGYVQHKVSELEQVNNPFRDKSVVKLPDGTKVKLPDGVKDADVDTIIQINGEIKVIPTAEMEAKLMDTKKVIEDAQNTNKSAKATLERLKNKQNR